MLLRDAAPLTVLETHAGAGAYDLDRGEARRSGEAEAGVGRLMRAVDLPPPLAALAAAVATFNGRGRLHAYPGSPILTLERLRGRDRYIGCELEGHAYAALAARLRPYGGRQTALNADGYAEAAQRLRHEPGRVLLVVDPPFERADDYARTAELIAARPRPAGQPCLVWTPLKDLETFDAFLGRLEAARPARLEALQVRLHPLDDPLRLNGCALVLVDGPDVSADALAAGRWIAERLGGVGALARFMRLC